MDAAVRFANHFASTPFEALPADVVAIAKHEVLDTLGVAVAGIGQPGAAQLQELLTEWGGKPECSVIGTRVRLPAPHAAQINVSMAHARDFDDVHQAAVMHPGIVTVLPALAAAELRGEVSGRAFIRAVVLGVDMICRLGLATRPGISPIMTGWHFTSIYGYPTAALTAGAILQLPPDQLVSAFGIAYHQSSGNGQAVTDGALTKRLGPGLAARGGVAAALMAARGITGARDSLEGQQGLYAVYHGGQYDRDALIGRLGECFEGVNVTLKPYPCCRGVHPSIDAALQMVRSGQVLPQEIDSIVLRTGAASHQLLGTPEEVKIRPRNVVDSQFSIPWGIATALARGRVRMEDFSTAAIADAVVLDLARRIRIEVDPALNSSRGTEPAILQVRLRSGPSLEVRVDAASGSPEQPLSFEDCVAKFNDCVASAGGRISSATASRAVAMTAELERVEDVRGLIQLFCEQP